MIANDIQKFIDEYELLIKQSDIMIDSITKDIGKHRRALTDRSIERQDLAAWNARRQAYVQAKVNFESLMDCVL